MMMTLIPRMSEIEGATSMVSRFSMERRVKKAILRVLKRSQKVVRKSSRSQSSMRSHT